MTWQWHACVTYPQIVSYAVSVPSHSKPKQCDTTNMELFFSDMDWFWNVWLNKKYAHQPPRPPDRQYKPLAVTSGNNLIAKPVNARSCIRQTLKLGSMTELVSIIINY